MNYKEFKNYCKELKLKKALRYKKGLIYGQH